MTKNKPTIDFGEGFSLPSFSFGTPVEDEDKEIDFDEVGRLLALLEEKDKVSNLHKWFRKGSGTGFLDLPKHHAFFKAGTTYKERYFSASNRTGKTISGAYETALHATGLYPDDCEGKRFDKPIRAWAVGTSKETTRDILQKELVGSVDDPGSGMIPPDLIVKTVYRPNSGGAIDYLLVKSAFGGTSYIGFKSYEQGIESFYGTALDVVWMDELPPASIYSEAYTRTMTTDGIVYVTATPLAGLTPFVLSFYTSAAFLPEGSEVPGIVAISKDQQENELLAKVKSGDVDILEYEQWKKEKEAKYNPKAVVVAGWKDAPWLSKDTQERMLAATPPHLRTARSTGLPSMGSGSVFTIPVEDILVPDFPIPDHWKKVCGMDVGWNNTAAMWMAINPDTNEKFFYSEYKRGGVEPAVHAQAIKQRGEWINIAIDPASRGRSQKDGEQLFVLYRGLGLRVHPADNAVESGIYSLQEDFASGQLKVFNSCIEFQKEYVTYRRGENGKIIKENDHCLDAGRYSKLADKLARAKPQPKLSNSGGIQSGKQYDI